MLEKSCVSKTDRRMKNPILTKAPGFKPLECQGMSMRFESVEARDAYIPHPEHKKVVDMILPLVKNGSDSVIAVDWYLTGDNEIGSSRVVMTI